MLGISVQLRATCAETLALLWRDRILKRLDFLFLFSFLLNFGTQPSRDGVFLSYLKKDHCTYDFHMNVRASWERFNIQSAGYSGV